MVLRDDSPVAAERIMQRRLRELQLERVRKAGSESARRALRASANAPGPFGRATGAARALPPLASAGRASVALAPHSDGFHPRADVLDVAATVAGAGLSVELDLDLYVLVLGLAACLQYCIERGGAQARWCTVPVAATRLA